MLIFIVYWKNNVKKMTIEWKMIAFIFLDFTQKKQLKLQKFSKKIC